MNKDKSKDAVQEYVDTQRERIAKSRNARKWFYRGVIATLAAGYVYAKVTQDDQPNEES